MQALHQFDTLKSFNALKRSGIKDDQAETLVEMIKDATNSSIERLATKEDLLLVEVKLKEEIASVRADNALLRAEFKEDIARSDGKLDMLTKIVFGFCLVVVINMLLFWFHH